MFDFFDDICERNQVSMWEYMAGLKSASNAEVRKALRTAAKRKDKENG